MAADHTPLLAQRVLCLHGSHQSASVFQGRLQRLQAALPPSQADLVYLDGPHFLPLNEGDTVNMRTWFRREPGAAEDSARCCCEALALWDRVWKRYGPFDGVIGFSAGAIASCMIASMPDRFQGLSWAIISGCPNIDDMKWCSCSGLGKLAIPTSLRSLHVFGKMDTLVAPQKSLLTAQSFTNPMLLEHEQGHSFPMRKREIEQYLTFIHECSNPDPGLDPFIRQEEIESIAAIYAEETTFRSSEDIGLRGGIQLIHIKIPLEGTPFTATALFELTFRLGATYPNSLPSVSIRHEMGMLEFHSNIETALLQTIMEAIEPLIGSPMIFDAVSTATQFLQDYQEPDAASPPAASDEDDDLDDLDTQLDEDLILSSSTSPLANLKSKNARGRWCHTIGLVGKPSAGKSTFFNAATRSLIAKVGAFPFTTIDPNVAPGNWKVPEQFVPKKWVEEGKEVLIPCVLKDVAGLVPGAWEGRGRGNKFLNDLCTADVLIHIIDGSGLSDTDGNILPLEATPQDPLNDIHWVRLELYQWILNNLLAKWPVILKRPQRLAAMFSGYQAPRWLVHEVLVSAGFDVSVSPQDARRLWTRTRLEGCVNVFLDARFPMLLALNKADLPPAEAHIRRVKEVYGSDRVVPVCAASEVWVQAKVAEGSVEYARSTYGSKTTLKMVNGTPFALDKERAEFERIERVVDKFNGTGVDAALTAAILLRPPVFCYPVEDLEAVTSLVFHGTSRSCLPVKPGSTVLDVFDLLAHGPEAVLNGQFVRAEAVGMDGMGKRPVKKEMEMDASCATPPHCDRRSLKAKSIKSRLRRVRKRLERLDKIFFSSQRHYRLISAIPSLTNPWYYPGLSSLLSYLAPFVLAVFEAPMVRPLLIVGPLGLYLVVSGACRFWAELNIGCRFVVWMRLDSDCCDKGGCAECGADGGCCESECGCGEAVSENSACVVEGVDGVHGASASSVMGDGDGDGVDTGVLGKASVVDASDAFVCVSADVESLEESVVDASGNDGVGVSSRANVREEVVAVVSADVVSAEELVVSSALGVSASVDVGASACVCCEPVAREPEDVPGLQCASGGKRPSRSRSSTSKSAASGIPPQAPPPSKKSKKKLEDAEKPRKKSKKDDNAEKEGGGDGPVPVVDQPILPLLLQGINFLVAAIASNLAPATVQRSYSDFAKGYLDFLSNTVVGKQTLRTLSDAMIDELTLGPCLALFDQLLGFPHPAAQSLLEIQAWIDAVRERCAELQIASPAFVVSPWLFKCPKDTHDGITAGCCATADIAAPVFEALATTLQQDPFFWKYSELSVSEAERKAAIEAGFQPGAEPVGPDGPLPSKMVFMLSLNRFLWCPRLLKAGVPCGSNVNTSIPFGSNVDELHAFMFNEITLRLISKTGATVGNVLVAGSDASDCVLGKKIMDVVDASIVAAAVEPVGVDELGGAGVGGGGVGAGGGDVGDDAMDLEVGVSEGDGIAGGVDDVEMGGVQDVDGGEDGGNGKALPFKVFSMLHPAAFLFRISSWALPFRYYNRDETPNVKTPTIPLLEKERRFLNYGMVRFVGALVRTVVDTESVVEVLASRVYAGLKAQRVEKSFGPHLAVEANFAAAVAHSLSLEEVRKWIAKPLAFLSPNGSPYPMQTVKEMVASVNWEYAALITNNAYHRFMNRNAEEIELAIAARIADEEGVHAMVGVEGAVHVHVGKKLVPCSLWMDAEQVSANDFKEASNLFTCVSAIAKLLLIGLHLISMRMNRRVVKIPGGGMEVLFDAAKLNMDAKHFTTGYEWRSGLVMFRTKERGPKDSLSISGIQEYGAMILFDADNSVRKICPLFCVLKDETSFNPSKTHPTIAKIKVMSLGALFKQTFFVLDFKKNQTHMVRASLDQFDALQDVAKNLKSRPDLLDPLSPDSHEASLQLLGIRRTTVLPKDLDFAAGANVGFFDRKNTSYNNLLNGFFSAHNKFKKSALLKASLDSVFGKLRSWLPMTKTESINRLDVDAAWNACEYLCTRQNGPVVPLTPVRDPVVPIPAAAPVVPVPAAAPANHRLPMDFWFSSKPQSSGNLKLRYANSNGKLFLEVDNSPVDGRFSKNIRPVLISINAAGDFVFQHVHGYMGRHMAANGKIERREKPHPPNMNSIPEDHKNLFELLSKLPPGDYVHPDKHDPTVRVAKTIQPPAVLPVSKRRDLDNIKPMPENVVNAVTNFTETAKRKAEDKEALRKAFEHRHGLAEGAEEVEVLNADMQAGLAVMKLNKTPFDKKSEFNRGILNTFTADVSFQEGDANRTAAMAHVMLSTLVFDVGRVLVPSCLNLFRKIHEKILAELREDDLQDVPNVRNMSVAASVSRYYGSADFRQTNNIENLAVSLAQTPDHLLRLLRTVFSFGPAEGLESFHSIVYDLGRLSNRGGASWKDMQTLALLLRLADPHANANYPNVEISDLPKVGGGVGRDEWVKAMDVCSKRCFRLAQLKAWNLSTRSCTTSADSRIEAGPLGKTCRRWLCFSDLPIHTRMRITRMLKSVIFPKSAVVLGGMSG
ncbi:hypothetical protein HDU98_007413, partial [Podochytrium sp. JEL0797]